jgi:hypothetical protein
MMKLYTKKYSCEEQPRKEIIQYLVNYSKQLRVIKTNKNNYIEFYLN